MSSGTTLGERIKMLRGTASQKQFAQTLGIPQTTLANYETNKNELSFTMIRMFTRKFGVNTDWLIFGEGPRWASSREGQGAEELTQVPESSRRKRSVPQNAETIPESKLHCILEKMQSELDLERKERRELAAENRQLSRDKVSLVQEVAELKVKLARLELSHAAAALKEAGTPAADCEESAHRQEN